MVGLSLRFKAARPAHRSAIRRLLGHVRHQHQRGQRRQRQQQRVRMAVAGFGLHRHAPAVAHARAAIDAGVGVEQFAPGLRRAGHADPVVVARRGREVADHQHRGRCLQHGAAQQGEHAVAGVVAYDPAEAFGRRIEPVQRGLAV
jgi:hypothetical protein